MTAIATETPRSARGLGERLWDVVRLHATNPWTTLILPWLITLAIFGMNYAIWALVSKAAGGDLGQDAFSNNGGVTWILVYLMVVAVQAMSATFRFALGMSVTRRDYYLGTALYFTMLSVVYATGLTVLGAIERLTDGWGLDGYFFAPFGSKSQSLGVNAYAFLLLMLMFFFMGTAFAAVWMRWKVNGLLTMIFSIIVTLVAIAWWITDASAWGPVGDFFTGHPLWYIVTWTLPITLAGALGGFGLLRRATP